MKRLVLILILLCAPFIWAEPFNNSDCSLSLTDDIRAVSANPAALSFGAASGAGFSQSPDNVFSTGASFSDDFYLFLASPNLGWRIGKEDGSFVNTAALSLSPFKNIYLGGNYSWADWDMCNYSYSLGLLTRPVDALSIAAVYRNNTVGSWNVGFSLGVRPLFFKPCHAHRLEVAADVLYSTDGIGIPKIFLYTQPIDGLMVNSSYDFSDGTFYFSIGFSWDNMHTNAAAGFSSEFTPESFNYFVQLSPNRYPSVLSPERGLFLDYDPGTVLEEHPGISVPGFSIITGSEQTVWSVIDQIYRLAEDDSVRGIVFRNRLFQATRTNFHELAKALSYFKSAGKKIVFYYENVDTANYTFAAGVADKIFLHPIGSVFLTGTGSVHFYYNDLLKRFGINTVDLQSHEYKTANNQFTKSNMTEAERESLLSVYKGLQVETESLIQSGRGDRLTESIETIFDHGPYLVADKALEAGLVDGLLREQDLNSLLKEEMGARSISDSLPVPEIRQDWAGPLTEEIAIIYATGAIYTGEGIPGEMIGSDTLVRALREARNNPFTRAIVLRVDSPGGSAVASDSIAREIKVCRNEPYNLPVVVSMGSVAGSGGYYISCMADYIFAHPDTITGSIGVAGFSFDIESLLEKIDVRAVSLFTREMSDLGNITRKMTDEEFDRFRNYILYVYDTFVNTVSEGRGMNYDEVHNIGRGRIWTGKQAMELGLIDELGTLDDAVEKAKKLAGITGEVTLQEYDGFVFELDQMMEYYMSSFVDKGLPDSIADVAEDFRTLDRFDTERVLLFLPYRF